MIRLVVTHSEDTPCIWLQELKRYAAVSDDSQDALLKGLLYRAVLTIQEYADVSLLPCTFRLTVTDNESDRIRLYQTVLSVESVKDGKGEDIPFSVSGGRVQFGCMPETVVVEYTTSVEESSVCRFLPVVLRYATALYDGQDNDELSKIITEVC